MDEQAFIGLFRDHLQDVSKYLSRRTDSRHVEDLASEIFEIAWRKRADCPAGFELAWLYRISGFVLANHRRKAENRMIHLPIMDGDKTSPSAEDLALDGSGVAQAYQSLSSADRQILSLLVFEGLSVSEIAVVLGISQNTASQKLKRARARLASKLDQVVSENQ
ncbi:MAG: RNA polymerase sigma factor [Rhodoluna sp.]